MHTLCYYGWIGTLFSDIKAMIHAEETSSCMLTCGKPNSR